MAKGTEEPGREELLAENRARRAQIRADEAEKAARKRDSDATDADETGAEESGADETGVDAAGGVAGDAAPRARSGRGLVIALSAAVVVLVVAVGVLGYLLATSDADEDSAANFDTTSSEPSGVDEQVVAVAKDYAVTVLTYSAGDYGDLDKRIRAISTPEFADRYIKSSQQAREGNDAAKAEGSAEAKAAGLVSISDSKAVVLVAVDQTVKTPMVPSAAPEGMQYQSRLQLTLVRDSDDWKLSYLSVV